jgi:Transposase domain (DUF772)
LTRKGKATFNGIQGGTTIMMGLKERAFAPLVAVSLEELVPQDHFYRHLQTVLDLSFVYDLVRESYSVVGRPSIDPVVFFKLQLVMFFEDIRSERLLLRQVADRLSVRWYVGYDLEEPLPDHSTLSQDPPALWPLGISALLRGHRPTVSAGEAGLGQGGVLRLERRVHANADLDSLAPRFAVEAREAIREHLGALFASEPGQPEQVEESNMEAALLESLREDASGPKPLPLPVVISGIQREELAADNAVRHDWIARSRQARARRPREILAHG